LKVEVNMDIIVAKNAGGQIVTVGLKGRLDAATSKSVEDQLLQLIEQGERRMVMDFGELHYISSVGLRVLILVAKRLKQVNGRIVMCSLSDQIKEVFAIAGFGSLFAVFDTRDQAVAGMT